MSIKKLTIEGFRGFSEKKEINFAMPDGEHEGSGLTILVGPNNSGKSSVIEAVHMLSNNTRNVPKESRNEANGHKLFIEAINESDDSIILKTTKNSGSSVEILINNKETEYNEGKILNAFILSSKRAISSTFNSNYAQNRDEYKSNAPENEYRPNNSINNNFGNRLNEIFKKKEHFTETLAKVLTPVPEWTIESSNNGASYLEFSFGNAHHGSIGAGDGFINIFNIVDALYDSEVGNVTLIDEPEISLHPDLQKKLFNLIVEYSKDKQIIISTHSPFFINWSIFANYGKVIRFKKEKNKIETYELSEKSITGIHKIINDDNNVHTFGLDTNDIFFLQENVIVVEGQEDVVCYKKIFKNNDFEPSASFFGWGASGKKNIDYILCILKDLGYRKVFVIADHDAENIINDLKIKYENYRFYCIKAGDVHNKKQSKEIVNLKNIINISGLTNLEKKSIEEYIDKFFPEKDGLVESKKKCTVKEEYKEDVFRLIDEIKSYFSLGNIVQEENGNIEKESINNKIIEVADKKLAEDLFNNWLEKSKILEYIENIYKNFNFVGGATQLSIKEISNGKFYIVEKVEKEISNECRIVMLFHILVNTKKQKVILKQRKIIKNTLPLNFVFKIIEKIYFYFKYIKIGV